MILNVEGGRQVTYRSIRRRGDNGLRLTVKPDHKADRFRLGQLPMPDRINAITQLLRDDPDIALVVSGRIFAHELPDPVVSRMPLAAIVVSAAGSANTFDGGLQQLSDERLDVMSYSRTPEGAYQLYGLVHALLKPLTRTTVGDTVIHWARKAGGPIDGRTPPIAWPGMAPDPSSHWPRVVSTWQVLAADITPAPA
jgi:hypothetical protein